MAEPDWNDVRRRLDALRIVIERGWEPEPDEVARILKGRALALGWNLAEAQAGESLELIEFQLSTERYAVEPRYVREVHPLMNLTPLPCTPPFVLGIINLRGEILSVIDIKKFFDLPERGLTDLDKVIVLQAGEMAFGILADSILGARRVALTEIQPSLPTLTGIREKYLKGVTRERTVILDAEKLLNDESILVNEQVGS